MAVGGPKLTPAIKVRALKGTNGQSTIRAIVAKLALHPIHMCIESGRAIGSDGLARTQIGWASEQSHPNYRAKEPENLQAPIPIPGLVDPALLERPAPGIALKYRPRFGTPGNGNGNRLPIVL